MDILQKSGRKILISGFLEMTILFNDIIVFSNKTVEERLREEYTFIGLRIYIRFSGASSTAMEGALSRFDGHRGRTQF